MYGLDDAQWLAWQRKRKHTMIGFIMIGTLMGIDCSIISSTLFLYLQDTLHTRKPELWFGIIGAGLFISSTISGAIGYTPYFSYFSKKRNFVKSLVNCPFQKSFHIRIFSISALPSRVRYFHQRKTAASCFHRGPDGCFPLSYWTRLVPSFSLV